MMKSVIIFATMVMVVLLCCCSIISVHSAPSSSSLLRAKLNNAAVAATTPTTTTSTKAAINAHAVKAAVQAVVRAAAAVPNDSEYESGQGVPSYPGMEHMEHMLGMDMSYRDLIRIWVTNHPREYNAWKENARNRYTGGYYADPYYVLRCGASLPQWTRNPWNETYTDDYGTYTPPSSSSSSSSSTGYYEESSSSSSSSGPGGPTGGYESSSSSEETPYPTESSTGYDSYPTPVESSTGTTYGGDVYTPPPGTYDAPTYPGPGNPNAYIPVSPVHRHPLNNKNNNNNNNKNGRKLLSTPNTTAKRMKAMHNGVDHSATTVSTAATTVATGATLTEVPVATGVGGILGDILGSLGHYKPPMSTYDPPATQYPSPDYVKSYTRYTPLPAPTHDYIVDSICPRPAYEPECEATYLTNGYSVYGYDQTGYDPYGYDASGYDKNGWSRLGRLTNEQFNRDGTFANEALAEYHVKFDEYAKPLTTASGEILRFDPYGYDQYGYDRYGNPRPILQAPECGTIPLPPPKYQPPDEHTNLICESKSEEMDPTTGKRIYLRKAASAMTQKDWQRFRDAWNSLNMQGTIAKYTAQHAQSFQQHGSNKFAPWHREFLARLENELHTIDSCVFLPYWDVVAQPSLPNGIATTSSFPPAVRTVTNGQVTNTSPVTRNIGVAGTLPNAGMLSFVTGATTYPSFNQRLEQFHNGVHVWVGGDMGFVSSAPKDPAFWLHHANIDRIWHEWQQTHSNEPSATVIATINPLQFGAGDEKTYDSQNVITNVATSTGAGYRYI